QRERQVELAFEVDPAHLSGRIGDLLAGTRRVAVEMGIGSGVASGQLTPLGDSPQLEARDGVGVERYALIVDGATMLSLSARRGGVLRLDRLNHAHPVFRELLRGILSLATTTDTIHDDDFKGLREVLDQIVPMITVRQQGMFPRIEGDLASDEMQAGGNLVTVSRGRRIEDLGQSARLFLPRVLRDLVGGLATALDAELRRLLYLGPLRSYPPRHLAFSQHHDPNWYAGGGYAWDAMRTRSDVRERVNRWLGDAERLQTPYELQVRDLLAAGALPTELAPRLRTELYELAKRLVTDAEDQTGSTASMLEMIYKSVTSGAEGQVVFDLELEDVLEGLTDVYATTEDWSRQMIESRADALQDLVLVDKRSGTPVSHRDVGIGVSQVLPVLVTAYASTGRFLAIEQPEIHLHPGLQAELGDVFIESALGGDNRFLIETHSEHLLLRIMRRMRQTTAGELPEGISPVRPEDVMVLFVEPDGAQSLIREMPLNERGELVKAWPGGFFEEGMREIF
ncbi:MAG: AAA family ATPase, partial [Gammaproteobacteria bacterium]|nr:AAA family ATPase [Gammaproteobacteria bacterium]